MSSVSSAAPRSGRVPNAKGFDALLAIAIIAVLAASVRAIWFTPVDAMLGAAQKIFYIHVPTAIIGLYVACGLLFISSIMYLWIKDERLDRLAESSAELAVVFLGIVLVTGPVWGRTSWGTWWAWEARLTSSLFLWLLMIGYLVLRSGVESQETRARLSAVMGSLAALLVPFIHLTVKLFRGMHPGPVVLAPEKPKMPAEMLLSFGLSMVAFLLLFVALLRLRLRWAAARDTRLAMEVA
jgi:heme exporter protein C